MFGFGTPTYKRRGLLDGGSTVFGRRFCIASGKPAPNSDQQRSLRPTTCSCHLTTKATRLVVKVVLLTVPGSCVGTVVAAHVVAVAAALVGSDQFVACISLDAWCEPTTCLGPTDRKFRGDTGDMAQPKTY